MNAFDGLAGVAVGPIMARMNREAELEAVKRLAPEAGHAVLVIGFGPGVGIESLLEVVPTGCVIGLDPSAEMVRQASKRNAKALKAGRLTLHCLKGEDVESLGQKFDGAIAVNTLQMCHPAQSLCKALASTMQPGAKFVSITHEWAVKKDHGDVEAWSSACVEAFTSAGFASSKAGKANAENGTAILIGAVR